MVGDYQTGWADHRLLWSAFAVDPQGRKAGRPHKTMVCPLPVPKCRKSGIIRAGPVALKVAHEWGHNRKRLTKKGLTHEASGPSLSDRIIPLSDYFFDDLPADTVFARSACAPADITAGETRKSSPIMVAMVWISSPSASLVKSKQR